MALRFNHMELTLPMGSLDEGGERENIAKFYGEVFGFRASDVFIVKQNALLLATDDETSQFILMTQMKEPMSSPSYDHLGFLVDSRAEVDEILAKCEKFQQQDDRVKIKYYDDIPAGENTVHAFYVKYILPIYFDVQCIEYASEKTQPARMWQYR